MTRSAPGARPAAVASRTWAIATAFALTVPVASLTPAAAAPAAPAAPAAGQTAVYGLANGCYELAPSATGEAVHRSLTGWSSHAADPVDPAARFTFKAAQLGRFMLYGTGGEFVTATTEPGAPVNASVDPTALTDWTVTFDGAAFSLISTATGAPLVVDLASGALATGTSLVDPTAAASAAAGSDRFLLRPATGCEPFPDAELNVTGHPFAGTDAEGHLRGFVDSHAHLIAEQFLGGGFHCGKPFDPQGIIVALRDCPDHAPAGLGGIAENIVSSPQLIDTHDTGGWPTFAGYPSWESLTHEQSYYRWIERAWRGGQRWITNYLVQNRVLCETYWLGDQPCNEMESVRIQAGITRELQDYIDAQNGGPGKGFFRIVTTAAQARAVIAAGKLAVMLGIEVSEPFGCTEIDDVPQCTTDDIDLGLDELYDLGVRQAIVTHKFDNALGGTRFDQGLTGVAVNVGNYLTTGGLWQTEPCESTRTDNPLAGLSGLPGSRGNGDASPRCNVRGLTDLGEYTIRGLIARNMIIDIDHMGVKTADRALEILAADRYPGVVSSHTWVDNEDYRAILALGGAVGLFATPAEARAGDKGRHGDNPADFVGTWRILRAQRSPDYLFGLGYGPDMGGLGKQAYPRPSAASNPVVYPFISQDGGSMIDRQVTGTRVFDVNVDGTAHYGLLPDWIESLRLAAGPDGDELVADLFRGAEAYVQTWERTEAYEG